VETDRRSELHLVASWLRNSASKMNIRDTATTYLAVAARDGDLTRTPGADRRSEENNMSKSRNGNRAEQNDRSNQMNPNNPAHQGSREGSGTSKPAKDNRSNQLNPNNPAYERSRSDGQRDETERDEE
jgi:hypothetical protein